VIAVNDRGEGGQAVLAPVRRDGGLIEPGVGIDQKAPHALRTIIRADAGDLRRVAIRNRAVGRDEEEEVQLMRGRRKQRPRFAVRVDGSDREEGRESETQPQHLFTW
jgi:hypothetical protein